MADTKAMTLEEVRSALTGESAELVRRRRAFRRLPSPPRCKLCAAPFAGIGSIVLGLAGFRRSPGNPALCTKCLTELRKRGMSGVEIPVTLLFSDIRGSTGARGAPAPDGVPRLPRPLLQTVFGGNSCSRRSRRQARRRRGRLALLRWDQRTQPRRSGRCSRGRPGRAGGTRRRGPDGADSGRNRRPHGRSICRRDRAGRHDRGLHGARRRREYDRPARIGGACRRGDRQHGSCGRRGRRHRRLRATHRGNPWPRGAGRSDRPPPRRSRDCHRLVDVSCGGPSGSTEVARSSPEPEPRSRIGPASTRAVPLLAVVASQ